MKILCFIDELGSGGAERQLVGLASLLKQNKMDVDVYCYHPIYFYEYFLIENNVNLIKEFSKPKNIFEKIRRAFRVIQKGNYDAVIAFAPGAVMLSLIMKIIYRNFILIVSDRNNTPSPNLKQKLKFNLYRFADYIVPNSYSQRDIMVKLYPFMKPKIHVITNFVNINQFSLSLLNPKEYIKLIAVARHHNVKNIPMLLKSLALLKERGIKLKIDWYGNFDNPVGAANLNLRKELNVEDMIEFLPHRTDIFECYPHYDGFILPSKSEAFSNTIGEAMCCGLPILCSAVGDNGILVENGVNGILFESTTPDAIAKGIEKYINLPNSMKKEMGKISRLRAEKLLSPISFIEKYKALLN